MMKSMIYKKTLLLLIIIFSGLCQAAGSELIVKGNFSVFPSFTGNPVYDEILKGSESALLEVCFAAGRLVPVEYNYKRVAIEKSDGSDRNSLYMNTALYLKADVYAVITCHNEKGDFVLKLEIVPLNDKYKSIKSEKTVRSRIPENIPLKAAREFAALLQKTPLKSRVLEVLDDGSAVLDSGQWHGLEAGSYHTDSGDIKIKNVTRYTSIAYGRTFVIGENLDFMLYPDLENFIKKINYEITENTVRAYGTDEVLDKRGGRVKESIKGTCIINEGANFCLPGYGSFLAVDYMGIEKGKSDIAGIVITSSLTAVHLGLIPLLTDFEVKFAPWIEDADRTEPMRRLNYYAWGTLPLTFAASYFSQLSYNYSEKKILPPQFNDYDSSAAILSVFVPGGGMFYKGYRWSGWGFYTCEMSLAGYAVYTDEKEERRVLLGSLVLIKGVEIITSYFIDPAYDFFNREISSAGDTGFSAGFRQDVSGERELTASISLSF